MNQPSASQNQPQIKFYNTASRSIEVFRPIHPGQVGLYTCGPTVYDYAHIGNLRTYIFEDILRRTLEYNGLNVKQVMNVTDVGHLTSDADEGEDKMEKGARQQGKTVWEVAQFYQEQFFNDLAALNIEPPNIVAKATNEIEAQQQLIQQLLDKHSAYITDKAIYFDVTTFPKYWEFSGQKLSDKQEGAREEVHTDSQKRHPADFALWLFTVGEHANHAMRWPSPWGEGFPGWHIECSAISMKYLGQEFDIHTGGVDHIGTHHPNEIAQSVAATGKKFAHYWLHGEFLNISGDKMSKSKDNFYRLQTIIDHHFTPLDYRYFCLTAHYRSVLDFSWDRLQVAATSYKNLKRQIGLWGDKVGEPDQGYLQQFKAAINNDLDMPGALTVMWKLVNEDIPLDTKRSTMNQIDMVLGLDLANYIQAELTTDEEQLIDLRQQARDKKDWKLADQLRDELLAKGIEVNDTPQGTEWTKTT
jgi:cysteinyl-tRNA synthetase